MKQLSFARAAVVAASAMLCMGSSCPLIPDAEERTIELATVGVVSREFVASGDINTYDKTDTFDIAAELDVPQILDDAGVDLDKVDDITMTTKGVSYRVVKKDPTAGRRIENGGVTIQRGGGPVESLVVDFNVDVNNAVDWETAELDADGVAVLNQMLSEILSAIQNDTPVPSMPITYHISGDSVPGSIGTDFTWELRLEISIAGPVTINIYH